MWWYFVLATIAGLALGVVTGKYFQARGEAVRLELAREEAVQQERKERAGSRLTPAQNLERLRKLSQTNNSEIPYVIFAKVLRGAAKGALIEMIAFIGPTSGDMKEIERQSTEYEVQEFFPFTGLPKEMAIIGGILFIVKYAKELKTQGDGALQKFVERFYPHRSTMMLRGLLDELAVNSLKKSSTATRAGLSATQMFLQELELEEEVASPTPDMTSDETPDPQGLEALLEAGIGTPPAEWQPATTTAEDPNGFVPPAPTAPIPNPALARDVEEELSPAPTLEEPPIVAPRQTMWREGGNLVPDPLPPPPIPTSPAPARETKRTMLGGFSSPPVPDKAPKK